MAVWEAFRRNGWVPLPQKSAPVRGAAGTKHGA